LVRVQGEQQRREKDLEPIEGEREQITHSRSLKAKMSKSGQRNLLEEALADEDLEIAERHRPATSNLVQIGSQAQVEAQV